LKRKAKKWGQKYKVKKKRKEKGVSSLHYRILIENEGGGKTSEESARECSAKE
jgi:hypothetical protein